MTAYDAAKWYMLGCAWCVWAFAVTAISPRPSRWIELAVAYAVVMPLNAAWRDV